MDFALKDDVLDRDTVDQHVELLTESVSGSIPWHMVSCSADPCRRQHRVTLLTQGHSRFTVEVVFATPPFWLARATTRAKNLSFDADPNPSIRPLPFRTEAQNPCTEDRKPTSRDAGPYRVRECRVGRALRIRMQLT